MRTICSLAERDTQICALRHSLSLVGALVALVTSRQHDAGRTLAASAANRRALKLNDIVNQSNISDRHPRALTGVDSSEAQAIRGVFEWHDQTACAQTAFDQLREGQAVTFDVGQGAKGRRGDAAPPDAAPPG
jgi:hypothetical protein